MKKEFEQMLISSLQFEWCEEGGFLFDYRFGKFNDDAYIRTRNTISAIDFGGEEKISRRVVGLIYSIPFFLQGHQEHVLRKGGSKLLCNQAINEISSMLIEIFGEGTTSPQVE